MATSQAIAFVASDAPAAQAALNELKSLYGDTAPDAATVIVALGGDGFMLETLHRYLALNLPIFGMHRGSVGFLMNGYGPQGLRERLARAVTVRTHPLEMRARDVKGAEHTALAFNEVSLLRETRQTAKLEVIVNTKVRIPELSCDGVLVATPAGSTAYNLSANGPILPLGSALLALTPISPFRPRRWRGAILPDSSNITFRVLEAVKRPVAVVADQKEFRDVSEVSVSVATGQRLTLLFDPGHSLDERIVTEQFQV